MTWAKVIGWLTALPKSGNFFGDQDQHIWGMGLWTYFWLQQGKPWWGVLLSVVALSSLHEFWYDRLLPGAAPGVGSLVSDGRLENWTGYMAGITLGYLLHFLPIVGMVGSIAVVVTIFAVGIVQAIKSA